MCLFFSIGLYGSVLVSMIRSLGLLFFIVGMSLIGLGVKRRVGTSPRCAKCNYIMVAGGAGSHCPECGASWGQPGTLVRRRVVSPTA